MRHRCAFSKKQDSLTSPHSPLHSSTCFSAQDEAASERVLETLLRHLLCSGLLETGSFHKGVAIACSRVLETKHKLLKPIRNTFHNSKIYFLNHLRMYANARLKPDLPSCAKGARMCALANPYPSLQADLRSDKSDTFRYSLLRMADSRSDASGTPGPQPSLRGDQSSGTTH